MAISTKSGSIYFLRERDYLSGEISPYVKIGLVRDEKATEYRIAEHQTGNPRQIVDFKTLKSPFVEYLETQLHYRYAHYWVAGEWFVLDEERLGTVVSEAKSLIKQFKRHRGSILESQKLSKVESIYPERKVGKNERAWAVKLRRVKLRKDVLEAQRVIVSSQLRSVLGSAGSIDGVASVVKKEGGISFDKTAFETVHPFIYKKYLNIEKMELSGSFTLRSKMQLRHEEPKLYEAMHSAKEEVGKLRHKISSKTIRRSADIENLHTEYLEVQRQIYITDWEYHKLEAALKNAVGLSKGLEGLCGWNRTIQTKIEFNQKQFKEERPRLYEKFQLNKPITLAISINPCRPYAFKH